MPRAKRNPWILIGFLSGVGIVALAAPFLYDLTAQSRMHRIETLVAERSEELSRRDPHREVLYGAGTPGFAWSHYAKAQFLAKGLPVYELGLWARGESDRESLLEKVEPFFPALEELQLGAHKVDISRPPGSEGDPSMSPYRLAVLGILRARFLAEDGRSGPAIGLLLDVMQYQMDRTFQADWWETLTAISHQCLVVDELLSLMKRGMMAPADAAKVEQALKALDDRFPSFGDGLITRERNQAVEILKHRSVKTLLASWEFRDPLPLAWRYASDRLILGHYVELSFSNARWIATGDDLSWPEVQQISREASAVIHASPNPILKRLFPNGESWTSVQRAYREIRAKHRLARAAMHWSRIGVVPDLEDPFGTRLRWAKSRDVLKLWSIGGDGKDDGGLGDWTPRRSRDIVLELRR